MATLATRISDLATAIRDKFNLLTPNVPEAGGTASQYWRGDKVWAIPPGGGGGGSGLTVVDFGAFPGKSDASAAITGQTGILDESIVKAWLVASPTADHSADEHWLETISVMAGSITEGVGFTIFARNTSEINEPVVVVEQVTRNAGPGTGINQIRPCSTAGKGTRLYGQFTVAWEWT